MSKKLLTSVAEIRKLDDESVANISVANFDGLIASEIEKISTKWSKEVETEKEAKAKLETQYNESVANYDKMKKQLDELHKSLKDREDGEKFNARMQSLDADYDLDDEARKAVADDIYGADDDNFKKWHGKFSKYAKKKVVKADKDNGVKTDGVGNEGPTGDPNDLGKEGYTGPTRDIHDKAGGASIVEAALAKYAASQAFGRAEVVTPVIPNTVQGAENPLDKIRAGFGMDQFSFNTKGSKSRK